MRLIFMLLIFCLILSLTSLNSKQHNRKIYVYFPSLCYIAVSPCMKKAAFAVNYRTTLSRPRGKITGTASGLYLMDLENRTIKQITADSSDSDPSFAPDGTTLFFTRSDWEVPCTRIWKLDLRTLKASPLSPKKPFLCEISPTPSPDGKFIAYINLEIGQGSLFLMDMKDGKRKRLPVPSVRTVNWLPNGKIICSSYGATQSCDTDDCSKKNYLIILDPMTEKIEKRWNLGLWHISPIISSDGQKILTSLGWHYDPGYGLFIINLQNWEIERQILMNRINTIGCSVERFTSIPISQIDIIELKLRIDLKTLTLLKQYKDELERISYTEDLRPFLKKIAPQSLPHLNPISLRDLNLTKQRLMKIIDDAQFLVSIQRDENYNFSSWTWVKDDTILCIVSDRSRFFEFMKQGTEIVNDPQDIWLINILTGESTRLTYFGTQERRLSP